MNGKSFKYTLKDTLKGGHPDDHLIRIPGKHGTLGEESLPNLELLQVGSVV